MSLGKFDSPPPQLEEDLTSWAKRLVAWLVSEESAQEDTQEDDFVFGGAGVASRLFGFEGKDIDPAAAAVLVLLAAPVAGRKKIITDLLITVTGDMTIRMYKDIGADEYEYGTFDLTTAAGFALANVVGRYIVLDGDTEKLEIEVVANASDDDIHWNGNYLDVD